MIVKRKSLTDAFGEWNTWQDAYVIWMIDWSLIPKDKHGPS
jgi:hypothetical protein